MNINKIEPHILEMLQLSLKNYILAWFKIPHDLDPNHLNMVRIRYVKEWGTRDKPEDGFILEVKTSSNQYRKLLGRSELGLTVEQYKEQIDEQSKNSILFGKDFILHREWYEFPVIWGDLDKVFDDEEYYEEGGKYFGENYKTFGMKYD